MEQLKAIREQQEVTQEDIAFRMGISQPAVSSIESGNTDPKLGTLRRYANALGCVISHHVEMDDGNPVACAKTEVVNKYDNYESGVRPTKWTVLAIVNGRPSLSESSGYQTVNAMETR